MRADLQRLKRDTDSGRSAATLSAGSADFSVVAGSDSRRREAGVSQTERPKWKSWAFAGSGLGLLVIAYFMYVQSRPLPPPKVSGYFPVTHDGNPKGLVGTDGARLFFNEACSSGSVIAQVSSTGGEVAQVSIPAPTMSLLAVSPDGATLLVADEVARPHSMDRSGECQCSAGQLADWERPLGRLRPGLPMAKGLFTPQETAYSWQRAMVPKPTSSCPRQIESVISHGRRTEQ
jgi:hypothetical protein